MLELSTIVNTLEHHLNEEKLFSWPDQCNELNQWTLADWDSAGVLNFRPWTRCPQYADLSPLPLQDYLTPLQIISRWSRLFYPHPDCFTPSIIFQPNQNSCTPSKSFCPIHIISSISLPKSNCYIQSTLRILFCLFQKTSMFWVLSIKVPSQGKVRSGKDWIRTTFLNKSEYL